MNVFHALIERLALNGCLVGKVREFAQETGHFLIDRVGFPILPAHFEEGELGSVVEGEKVVPLDMSFEEAVFRVVGP